MFVLEQQSLMLLMLLMFTIIPPSKKLPKRAHYQIVIMIDIISEDFTN
jgi:hypothetical protein